eukprot:4867209-Prorocentrum_lima.AAC.1
MRCKVSVLRFLIPSISSSTTLRSSGGSIRGSQFSSLGVGGKDRPLRTFSSGRSNPPKEPVS